MTKLPFDEMWADDPYWLPDVLADKKLRGKSQLNEQDRVVEHQLIEANF